MSALQGTIEVVRGRLDDDLGQRILRFWGDNGALSEARAAERLPEVVCVLLDDKGSIQGVNSVHARAIPLIDDCVFWVYRSYLLDDSTENWQAMAAAAFDVLHGEFNPGPIVAYGLRGYPEDTTRRPAGLCVQFSDPAEMERSPQAHWSSPPLTYAGYDAGGAQLRIGFFDWASATGEVQVDWTPQPLEDKYEIRLLDHDDETMKRRVIELWSSEGVVSREEAGRRIGEVLMVATERDGTPVGVCTVFLGRNEQIGMRLWHFRTFVTEAHRMSHIASELAGRANEHLEERFVSGADTRGVGFFAEVESEILKRYFCGGTWIRPAATYVGSNARGDHLRVRYFPGVEAPLPSGTRP